MPFRGYFALNDEEIANSSRVLSHLGAATPTNDLALGGLGDSCDLVPYPTDAGLAYLPDTSTEIGSTGLATPPDGSRRYDPGLLVVGDCWDTSRLCGCVTVDSGWDDTWPGLLDFLQDTIYRPELAPWYSTQIPESAEFGGVYVLDAKGFGPPVTDRPITELVGTGAVSAPHRFASRKMSFDAVLVACTNAGLEFGIQWLQCQLEKTIGADGTLRYFVAHPTTDADPESLLRELHGVVMTQSVTQQQGFNARGSKHQQATVARVSWELTAKNPYAYLPPINLPITWDSIAVENINWVHAPKCVVPAECDPMPVLFSETCTPEQVNLSSYRNPPVCGGCLPVCQLERYIYTIPNWLTPPRCRETAATVTVKNEGPDQLTLQMYWKRCDVMESCNSDRWPAQISGLPGFASITLDAVTRRYTAKYAGHPMTPMGIVGTPSGVPWAPPVLDRSHCWEFEILAPAGAEFIAELNLYDREA